MTSDTHAAGLVDQGEWLQTRPRERCLVAAATTNGACSVVEIPAHPGDSTPMQVRQDGDEHLLVLEDAARITRGSESFDCSRDCSAAEGHFETTDHLRQGAGSSLVRRLVWAQDDPAKRRVRAWLSDIDDERLFSLGLTSEDIVALRNTVSRPTEAVIDAPSEDSDAS